MPDLGVPHLGAIFLHWLFTVAFILGSQTADLYTFVTNVFIYSGNWIKRESPGFPTQPTFPAC